MNKRTPFNFSTYCEIMQNTNTYMVEKDFKTKAEEIKAKESKAERIKAREPKAGGGRAKEPKAKAAKAEAPQTGEPKEAGFMAKTSELGQKKEEKKSLAPKSGGQTGVVATDKESSMS